MTWKDERNLLIDKNCSGLQPSAVFLAGCDHQLPGMRIPDYREVPPPTQRQRELIAAIEARMTAEADSTLGTEGAYVALAAAEARTSHSSGSVVAIADAGHPTADFGITERRSTASTVRQYIGPDAVGNERVGPGCRLSSK